MMTANHESRLPSFAVAFPRDARNRNQSDSVLPSDGVPLWEGVPNALIWGEWSNNYQLRTMCHPLGKIALIGDCFVDNHTLQTTTGRALEKRQPELLTSLPGSYATLVLEKEPNQGHDSLSVFSNLAGMPLIYFAENRDHIIVGSHPSLVADRSRRTLDGHYLTAQLVIPSRERSTIFDNNSCFKGVATLLGGQVLRITSEGAQVSTRQSLLPDPTMHFDEAATSLQVALEEAVAARLNTGLPLSCDFSGGLDSTSLAFLTTRQLEAGARLPAFFLVNPHLPNGDLRHIRRLYGIDARLNLTELSARTIAASFSYEDFEQLPAYEDLALAINNSIYSWNYAEVFYSHLSGRGSRLHISGHGGDEVVGSNPVYLADLMREGEIGRFIHEGVDWARLLHVAPLHLWHAMWRLSRCPTISLHQVAQKLKNPSAYPETTSDQLRYGPTLGPISGWLTDAKRQELADFFEARAQDRAVNGLGIADQIMRSNLNHSCLTGYLLKQNVDRVAPLAVPQFPFLDNNVTAAVSRLSAYRRGDPQVFKLILQEALRGVVPNDVFQRKSKGLDPEAYLGLRLSLPAIRTILSNSCLGDLGIIEPSRVKAALGAIDTASIDFMWALQRIVLAEGWLRGLEKTTPFETVIAENRPDRIHLSPNTSRPKSEVLPELLHARYAVPQWVHTIASDDGSLVLFNRHTNKLHPLSQVQSHLVRALAATGNLAGMVNRLKAHYPDTDPERIRADAADYLQELLKLHICRRVDTADLRQLPETAKTPGFVSQEFTTARDSTDGIPLRDRFITGLSFVIGELLIGRVASSIQLPLLWYIQNRRYIRPATHARGEQLLRAAQSLPHIGRIACREEAFTAALAAALNGERLNYHQGVSFKPLAFHAWVEAEGKPVRTGLEGGVVGSFQSFFE